MRCRLVSWNIHGCVGSDRRYDPGRVVAVLDRLNPDIIGLQEVDWRRPDHQQLDQFAFLAARLGMKRIEGPNLRDHRGRYGNGLLTRLEVIRERRIELAYPGREPRGAIDAELDGPGGRVRAFVTHLGLLRRERHEQIARLRGAIVAAGHQGATVLLGDMNEWTSLRRLRRQLMPWPFAVMVGGRSFPARWPWFALDCIFLGPRPVRFEGRVLKDRDARAASDHLPVLVEAEWDPAAAAQ